MREKFVSLSILVVALVLASGRVALAGEGTAPLGPLERVKSSVSRVLTIVEGLPIGSPERHTRIVRVTRELFDANEMARRALGQHWHGLSRIEQQEFVRLFGHAQKRSVAR